MQTCKQRERERESRALANETQALARVKRRLPSFHIRPADQSRFLAHAVCGEFFSGSTGKLEWAGRR